MPGSPNTGGYFLVGAGYPNGVGTTGTLTVTAGALLSEANNALIGAQAGGSGIATVSAGGIWQAAKA